MYILPKTTEMNKEFKLIDILKTVKADKNIISDAAIIDTITLTNVINTKTIDCVKNETFKEIYVFRITLKKREIPFLFLKALDKTIKFHTYFVFVYKEEIYTTMCFKQIGSSVKLGEYYCHGFYGEKPLVELTVNTVEDIYKLLYSYEVHIPCRKSESVEDLYKRAKMIFKLRLQIEKTEQLIIHEIQPIKKYDTFLKILEYKQKIHEL